MGKSASSVHIFLITVDETQEKKEASLGEKMIQKGPISMNFNSKDTSFSVGFLI